MTHELARLPKKIPANWDPTEILVPDADYEVIFAAERRGKYFGRDQWLIAFRVIETGDLLPLWLNVPTARVTRSHAMADAYSVATGKRAPQDLARLRPSRFLSEVAFLARTRTIKENLHRVERPEPLHYCRIDYLIRRTAGRPPIQSRSASSS